VVATAVSVAAPSAVVEDAGGALRTAIAQLARIQSK